MKNSFIITLVFIIIIISLPLIFFSCCAEEQCGEEGTNGENVIHSTDTIYKKIPKLDRGPMMVQIGAFANKNNAEKFANDARSKLKTSIDVKLIKEGIYRVTIGEYKDINAARETLSFVKKEGYLDSFIRDEFGSIEK